MICFYNFSHLIFDITSKSPLPFLLLILRTTKFHVYLVWLRPFRVFTEKRWRNWLKKAENCRKYASLLRVKLTAQRKQLPGGWPWKRTTSNYPPKRSRAGNNGVAMKQNMWRKQKRWKIHYRDPSNETTCCCCRCCMTFHIAWLSMHRITTQRITTRI